MVETALACLATERPWTPGHGDWREVAWATANLHYAIRPAGAAPPTPLEAIVTHGDEDRVRMAFAHNPDYAARAACVLMQQGRHELAYEVIIHAYSRRSSGEIMAAVRLAGLNQ